MSMTRREALKSMGSFLATSGLVGASAAAVAAPAAPAVATPGPYTLPPLPYAYDALEPHIDARTMEIHHSRHHAAYIANLNKAVAGNAAVGQKPVDALIANLNALPEGIRTVVRNNGGGHSNHSLFWQMLKKGAPSEPQNQLGEALRKKFGNFNSFKEEFAKAATSVFGSGWAWLSMDGAKELRIETTPNQNSPLMDARTPLLGLDVWEHAYYLKYQNRRADYITAFFNVVNWPFVESRYR